MSMRVCLPKVLSEPPRKTVEKPGFFKNFLKPLALAVLKYTALKTNRFS